MLLPAGDECTHSHAAAASAAPRAERSDAQPAVCFRRDSRVGKFVVARAAQPAARFRRDSRVGKFVVARAAQPAERCELVIDSARPAPPTERSDAQPAACSRRDSRVQEFVVPSEPEQGESC